MEKKSIKLKLDFVSGVVSFVTCNKDFVGNVSVQSDRYCIDGKSIMGVYSLDLSHPIDVYIEADSEDAIVALIDSYKANKLV